MTLRRERAGAVLHVSFGAKRENAEGVDSTRTLRIASVPAHRAEAGAVLARSFLETPWVRHVFPDPVRRQRALPPFFTVAVADARVHRRVDGTLEGERLVRVAVWLPPGGHPWGLRRKLHALEPVLRGPSVAGCSLQARTGPATGR